MDVLALAGIGLETIAEECLVRHRQAWPDVEGGVEDYDVGGVYQWRKDGEYHMVNPNTIHKLQYATRTNNRQAFKEFSKLFDDRNHNLATLRGLMKIKFAEKPIPLDQVEPVSAIVKRFCTGAMSFGSISREAHESLAIAMNRLGGPQQHRRRRRRRRAAFKPDVERRFETQQNQAGQWRRAVSA